MNSRRTLILIAALLVGAVAAFALFSYVNGIEDRANGDAKLVEVFTIKQDIPKGLRGDQAFDQGFIEKDKIQAKFRPATAITDASQIKDKVAISNLATGQVVVSDQFVFQTEALATFSDLLKPGDGKTPSEVAITISVDQVRGVANLLVPGDFVNVLIAPTTESSAATVPGAEPGADQIVYTTHARYLYQKVQILAVGQQQQLQPGQTVATNEDGTPVTPNSGLITFRVPADAAQRIASVAPDSIYLTLVPKDYQPVPLPPFDPAEKLPAEEAKRLTPYGPTGLADEE